MTLGRHPIGRQAIGAQATGRQPVFDAIVKTWTLFARSVALALENRSVSLTIGARDIDWSLEDDDR